MIVRMKHKPNGFREIFLPRYLKGDRVQIKKGLLPLYGPFHPSCLGTVRRNMGKHEIDSRGPVVLFDNGEEKWYPGMAMSLLERVICAD